MFSVNALSWAGIAVDPEPSPDALVARRKQPWMGYRSCRTIWLCLLISVDILIQKKPHKSCQWYKHSIMKLLKFYQSQVKNGRRNKRKTTVCARPYLHNKHKSWSSQFSHILKNIPYTQIKAFLTVFLRDLRVVRTFELRNEFYIP